jgi:hypothetical protein
MGSAILVVAIAAVGAIAAALTATRRPMVSLGIIVLLASLSKVTLDTPVGTMRLEHPAIAVVAVVLLATGEFRQLLRLPRWTYALGICLAIYVAVLGLSSLLFAPDPPMSLRIVAWWSISIAGGVVALVLARRNPLETLEPFAFAGAAKGAAGIAVALLFLLGGPTANFGMQDLALEQPRVQAFTWEANLYASYLAASVPFGLELARRESRFGLAFLALMLIGFPLGLTRGAFLGLAAGVACYLAVWWWRQRTTKGLVPIASAAAVALVVGMVALNVLLPNRAERPPASSSIPSASLQPGQGSGRYGSTSPGATTAPVPTVIPYPDTIGFRLERIPAALADLVSSPLIGLGAESFAERHTLPDGTPDHIAILAIAVPYESGILGTLALGAAFALVLAALWRASARPSRTGPAAAYLAAIVSLLVSYQATNALHFAHNWLIIGAAIALASRSLIPGGAPSDKPSS